MRHLYLIIIVLSYAGICTGQEQQKDYAQGEIIVRFESGVLDSTFLLSSQRNTLTPRRIIRNTKIDSLVQVEDIYEFRKIVRPLPNGMLNTRLSKDNEKVLLDLSSIVMLRVTEKTDIPTLCEKLNNIDGVVYAEPNYILRKDDNAPNDTHFQSQFSFESIDFSQGDINAARAWDFTTGNETVKLGIIDSGIDYHHPDLGNGAYGATPGAIVRGGYDYINDDSDPDDDDVYQGGSHGTKVAGIIGARWNNSTGVAGLAGGKYTGPNKIKPGARLYAFKIVEPIEGNSTVADMAAAIVEASVPYYGFGCHIINVSSGGGTYSETMRDAIRYANQFGTLVVASKGNNNSTGSHYPADYDKEWVLAVGANDGFGSRLSASNYGGGIDVVAPGSESLIFTTSRVEDNVYENFLNTSAATPHVAGLAALIKSVNINLHPNDVEGVIKSSSDRTNPTYQYVNDFHEQMGYGKIDAGKAMEMMHAPWQLSQHTWTGGTIYNSSGMYTMQFMNNRGGSLNGTYKVIRHAVRIAPGTTFYQNNEFYAWGRSVGISTGWSKESPNYQLGFTEVIGKGTQSVNLQTYVYQVYTNTPTPSFIGWYPTTPANVVFAYTLLGIKEYTVVIDGPDLLEQGQQGSWTANAVNCATTPTSYQWYKKLFTSSSWTNTGVTSSAFNTTITANTNLRCDITCSGIVKTGYKNVYYDNGQLRMSNNTVTAYPNPANSQFVISGFAEDEGVSIEIYDRIGRRIEKRRLAGQQIITFEEEFDTRTWDQGFYYVKILYMSGKTESLKLYKEE